MKINVQGVMNTGINMSLGIRGDGEELSGVLTVDTDTGEVTRIAEPKRPNEKGDELATETVKFEKVEIYGKTQFVEDVLHLLGSPRWQAMFKVLNAYAEKKEIQFFGKTRHPNELLAEVYMELAQLNQIRERALMELHADEPDTLSE